MMMVIVIHRQRRRHHRRRHPPQGETHRQRRLHGLHRCRRLRRPRLRLVRYRINRCLNSPHRLLSIENLFRSEQVLLEATPT